MGRTHWSVPFAGEETESVTKLQLFCQRVLFGLLMGEMRPSDCVAKSSRSLSRCRCSPLAFARRRSHLRQPMDPALGFQMSYSSHGHQGPLEAQCLFFNNPFFSLIHDFLSFVSSKHGFPLHVFADLLHAPALHWHHSEP